MRKLMWFAVGFALAAAVGVYCLAHDAYLLFALGSAVLLAGCMAAFIRWKNARMPAMILFGCMVSFLWQYTFDQVYLSVPRAADAWIGEVEICATDYSEETEYGGSVEGYVQLNGKTYKVKAYLPYMEQIEPGDRIAGFFELRCTLRGCSRESAYYSADGLFLIAYPEGKLTVTNAEHLPWYGYPALVRRNVKSLLAEAFPEDVMGYAKALLLGDGSDLDYETDTAFKVSGIRHIIAVSGLHISILFSFILFLTGKRKRLASVLGIPVLLFFAAVAGFSPSITRACIMHGLMSIAFLTRKEYDAPTALSFAVLVMLVADPWTVSSVSFQLSVGCVAGILLFSERIQNYLLDFRRLGKYKGIPGRICRWFAVSVSVSLSATVITTPLCALYFGMVSLISVLTNLLTLWVITFIFYGILFVCIFGAVWLPLAKILAIVIAVPMRYVLLVAKGLAALPFAAVYMKSVYMVLWLIFVYVLLGILMVMRRKRPLLILLCGALGLCLALIASWTEPMLDECRVTVLDVGQGQCILLQSEGKCYMVDCGGDSAATAADEAAAMLMSQGIYRLDGLIITHFDNDHAEGAQYLMTRIAVDHIYLPKSIDENGLGTKLVQSSEGGTTIVTEILEIRYGTSCLQLIPSAFGMTDNESGLCILFQTENYDILITGDRSITGESELMRSIDLPDLELLVVGHHGSRYSTGEALLAQTTPEVAVISVSADNRYGHPTAEVLERLEKYGCIVYRTDRDGTVIFRG